jgi:hypothetical protein
MQRNHGHRAVKQGTYQDFQFSTWICKKLKCRYVTCHPGRQEKAAISEEFRFWIRQVIEMFILYYPWFRIGPGRLLVTLEMYSVDYMSSTDYSLVSKAAHRKYDVMIRRVGRIETALLIYWLFAVILYQISLSFFTLLEPPLPCRSASEARFQ